MEEKLTLEANRSGRLWAEDPEAWMHLCSKDGCPFCQEEGPPRSLVLCETPMLWVSGGLEPSLPGYICAICKRHVVEPYELSQSEQIEFWQDCMLIARGIATILEPVKINYEIHGNTIPHLHMHFYPRSPADVYVGYPIHNRARFTRSQEELDRIAQGIMSELMENDRLTCN